MNKGEKGRRVRVARKCSVVDSCKEGTGRSPPLVRVHLTLDARLIVTLFTNLNIVPTMKWRESKVDEVNRSNN